jgi:hypothetical protein
MIPDAVVLMESFYAEEFRRMQEFAAAIGVQLTTRLGSGQDGLAYATDNKSAIKALRFEQWYRKEPNVYLRLQALGLPGIAGFTIPELLRYDDELWVIETEFVVAPFVVDSAGATLDERSVVFRDFTDAEWQEWIEEREESGTDCINAKVVDDHQHDDSKR